MNISFENYEEYFLLYADNELTEAEKDAVNNFVAANPALKAELDLLLQTQCTPGEFLLPDDFKKNLYRPANIAVSQNHSEKLLLLVDGELDNVAKKQLINHINNNTEAQKEYHLLLATKNFADTNIVFPDKQKLYKKEKAPVVAINYFRLVAAACIITVVTGTFFFLNRSSEEGTETNQSMAAVSVQKPHDSGAHLPNTVISKNNNPHPLETQDRINTSVSLAPDNLISNMVHSTAITQKNTTGANNYNTVNTTIVKQNPTTTETNNNITNNSTANNTTAIQHADGTDNKVITPAVSENALTNNLQNNINQTVTSTNPQPLNLTNKAGSEDITFVADNNNNKNTKLKGFFRKVTRAVERTTNIKTTNDEEELLIGSFAIKL